LSELKARSCSLQPRFYLPVETDQGNPHAVVATLPNHGATELLRDQFRWQIVVQSEIALIERLAAQAGQERRRIVFGGKD